MNPLKRVEWEGAVGKQGVKLPLQCSITAALDEGITFPTALNRTFCLIRWDFFCTFMCGSDKLIGFSFHEFFTYEVSGLITHTAINHLSPISRAGKVDVKGKPTETFPLSIARRVSCKHKHKQHFPEQWKTSCLI